MSIKQDSQPLRLRAFTRNDYKPTRQYGIESFEVGSDTSSILNVIDPDSFAVRQFRGNTPLVEIANERLIASFSQRVKSETIDEVLPPIALDPYQSVGRILRGDGASTLIRADDYRITNDTGFLRNAREAIERLTGINPFLDDPLMGSNQRWRNQGNFTSSKEIKEQTGKVQLRRLELNTSENLYSGNSSIKDFQKKQGKLENVLDNYKLKASSSYHLNYERYLDDNDGSANKRNLKQTLKDTFNNIIGSDLVSTRDKVANYIIVADNEEELKNWQNKTLKNITKDIPSTENQDNSIGNTVNKGNFSKEMVRQGDFGDIKTINGNVDLCDAENNSKNIDNSFDTYLSSFNNSTNPEESLVYGVTTMDTVKDKFGAKRGLLYCTNKVLTRNTKFNKMYQQDKSCFEVDGTVVYKGTPCRSWTRAEQENGKHFYGKRVDDLIRYRGNGVDGSVLKDYVVPKIHPLQVNYSEEVNIFKEGNNENLFFTIENLAWTKEDLIEYNIPECEWGNNFGRKMWFPPIINNYSESFNPDYNKTSIIGRSEQLYSYKNTTRSANLSFTLIMDYSWYADNVKRDQLAKFFACGEGDFEPLTPRFTEYNKEPNNSSNSDEETTNVPKIIVDDAVPNNIEDRNDIDLGKFFFPNDAYNVSEIIGDRVYNSGTTYYETFNNLKTDLLLTNSDNIDNSQNVFDVGFGLNNSFEDTNKEKIRTVIQEIQNGLPEKKFYNISIIGNASKLFIGDDPDNYNIYLSARRSYSMTSFIFDLAGNSLNASDYQIDINLTSNNVITLSSGERINNLQDAINGIDDMFEDNDDYFFELNSIIVYKHVNDADNNPIITINIKGDSSAPSGTVNTDIDTINSEESKRSRNVKIDYLLIEERIETNDNESNEVYEDSSNSVNTEIVDDPIQLVENVEDYTIDRGDDLLNCFTRFEDSAVLQNEGAEDKNLLIDRTGFSGNKSYINAFHSQTPEDLHRRITFLSQLNYTGNSKTKFGAKNSVFGRMPVSILRIGDFVNSKIIINSVSLEYQMGGDIIWDTNHEGMGVQPMMVNVQMSFDILGSQSLKTHIDKLPNAMSFNFFANSTFYDSGIYKKAKEDENEQLKINKIRKGIINEQTTINQVKPKLAKGDEEEIEFNELDIDTTGIDNSIDTIVTDFTNENIA